MRPLIFFSLLAIVFISACRSSEGDNVTGDNDSGPLKGSIDSTCAQRLVNNFEKHERKLIGDSLKDTRSVWFSIKQLKSLISRIEGDSVKDPGIRFYFAAYDNDTTHKDIRVKEKYLGYSTLVMVSTHDTIVFKPTGERDTLHYDYFDNRNKRKGGILTALPENQGELCPPPVHCTEEGALLLP